MAKFANPGELRTLVTIESYTETQDADGYPVKSWETLGNRYAKWVNAHGTEVYEAMRMELREPATLTMRYHSLITPQCRIKKGTQIYEIISVDDVENRHRWMEIKVQRMVSAK